MQGALVDGVYRTAAWVVAVMLPPMAIFFPLFTLLEDWGFLPRVAFNLDRCFQGCKACGKQALCMCMGLGCNAAGVGDMPGTLRVASDSSVSAPGKTVVHDITTRGLPHLPGKGARLRRLRHLGAARNAELRLRRAGAARARGALRRGASATPEDGRASAGSAGRMTTRQQRLRKS